MKSKFKSHNSNYSCNILYTITMIIDNIITFPIKIIVIPIEFNIPELLSIYYFNVGV